MTHHLPTFSLRLAVISCLIVSLWGVTSWSARAQETSSLEATTPPFVSPAPIANLDEVAKQNVGLMAIPPRLGDDGSLEANPGETLQTQVRVRNTSGGPVRVSTIVEDFIIGDDGKTPVPVLAETSSRWSLSKWMELSLNDTVLFPGSSQTIPVVIRVPEDALPGGRYAMILHQPLAANPNDSVVAPIGGQASITQRVGTLVYLRIKGEVNEEAHIRNISVPSFQEFGPVPLKFEVENLSDIHISPSTVVEVTNMWGRVVETLEVPAQNVFPYTLRKFELQWDRVWGLGRYKARFITTYGTQGKVVAADAAFWIIPYKLLMALLLLMLAALAILIAVRRHLQHREDASDQHIRLLEDRISQLENELNQHNE